MILSLIDSNFPSQQGLNGAGFMPESRQDAAVAFLLRKPLSHQRNQLYLNWLPMTTTRGVKRIY
jgi:hypothetical protein